MRLAFKYFGTVLLGAAAFVSCSREVLPEVEKPEDEVSVEKPTTHTIRIKADGQDTRTQIVGTSSLWSEGDRLMVYQGYGYGKDGWNGEKKKSEEGTMTNGGRQMDFHVDFAYVDPEDVSSSWTDDDEEFKFLYRAVYPAENVQDNGNYMVVTLPDVQHPTRTSFDPKADILTSRPTFLMEQPDELSLSFKRQTALGQMTLKGLSEGAEIYTVFFYPSVSLVKEFRMNVFYEEDDMWGDTYFENGIVMQMPGWEVPAAGSSGTTEVLTSFMTCPLSLGEGDGFMVLIVTKEMVEDDTTGESYEQVFGYQKVVQLGEGRELVFTAGDATVFAVNMTGIEPIEIPDFELTFDEYTVADFPHINDENNPYIEIPYMVAGSVSGDDLQKVKTRASSIEAGESVWISFNFNHPWTVSFSEPWLSAINLYSGSNYGRFKIYAEPNYTGEPREATMTIASQFYGEVTVRVVQEAPVLSDFELTFDEYTVADFPHINDENDPYIEIPFMVKGSGGDNPKKVNTRASEVAAGGTVWISFNVNHPWTVSFSEPWLSAYDFVTKSDYGEFKVYAETNITGEPREATMTISSLVEGEVTVRVVQESFVQPRSISLNAPQTVPAYTPFDMEVVLDTDDQNLYKYTFIDNLNVSNNSNIKWVDGGVIIFAPGTYTFYAGLDYSEAGFYMESEPVTVTVTEPDAPTDWYFLIRRDNKPYLIHRVGSTDTSLELSDNELAQANEMAFSADRSTVYVVGAVPDENNVMNPCLWTFNGSGANRTDYEYPNMKATDVAVDNSDVYILVTGVASDGSGGFLVLKNGENDGDHIPASYETKFNVSDITAEGGTYYLCGANMKNYGNSDAPYYWRDLKLTTTHYSWPLQKHDLGSSYLSNPIYYPESIAVKDDEPYVVGSVRFSYGDFRIYRRALFWQGDDSAPDYLGPSSMGDSTNGMFYMFHQIVKSNGHFILVGEKYQDHNSYKDNWAPLLYFDSISSYNDESINAIPVMYSSQAGLNDVCLYNGVPALGGTLVDADNTPHPAFWEAPWREPFEWGNTTDTIVDFLVK